jgi:hypothetical protein
MILRMDKRAQNKFNMRPLGGGPARDTPRASASPPGKRKYSKREEQGPA